MKFLFKAAAIAVTLAGSAVAGAATYDFSYTFTDGQEVTGSVNGTLNGTQISDISNLQVSLDGAAFVGGTDATGAATSLKLYGFDAANGLYDSPATFSTVSTNNNFAIADQDPSGNPNYFFSFLGASNGGPLIGAGNFLQGNGLGGFQAAGDTVDTGTWNVTPVPLPAALPLLLSGLGMFGFAKRRRAV
jgi:hypothetical protein